MKHNTYGKISEASGTLFVLSIFSNIGNVLVNDWFPKISVWILSILLIFCLFSLFIYLYYPEIKSMDPKKPLINKDGKYTFTVFFFIIGVCMVIASLFGFYWLADIKGAEPKDSWFIMDMLLLGAGILIFLGFKYYFKVNREMNKNKIIYYY